MFHVERKVFNSFHANRFYGGWRLNLPVRKISGHNLQARCCAGIFQSWEGPVQTCFISGQYCGGPAGYFARSS
jgi:hypothetical protein